MEDKIRLGVSSCLLGAQVRFDGGHKLDRYLRDTLGDYVDFVPVCAEVEVGLPIPRETLRLTRGEDGSSRLMFKRSGEDMTERMASWARGRVVELEQEDLDGFVFKSKSPSCGMERVKVYDHNGVPQNVGVGAFAKVFQEHFPLLPVEEEGRLNDAKLRENFITAIFTLRRWRQLVKSGSGIGGLVTFHSQHKMLILSHSEKIYRDMGKLVANQGGLNEQELFARYVTLLQSALQKKNTVSKHVNVMQHIMGYFKKDLASDEKQEILELIDNYRQSLVPLIVPLTLLNHYVRKYDQVYLKQQVYLQPHPKELKLLNHV